MMRQIVKEVYIEKLYEHCIHHSILATFIVESCWQGTPIFHISSFCGFFFQHCTKQYDITFESHWSHRKKLYRQQWQWQNKVKDRSKDLVAKNRDFWKTTFFLRNIIHKSFYNNKKLNTQIYKKVEQKTTFIADNNGLIIIIITDLSV